MTRSQPTDFTSPLSNLERDLHRRLRDQINLQQNENWNTSGEEFDVLFMSTTSPEEENLHTDNPTQEQMANLLSPMIDLLQAPTKGQAKNWLENQPPNSITIWDDLVSKFLHMFYPPSRTTKL